MAKRIRLSASESKQRILEAAEKWLIEGGPDAVRVQVVARDLGLTDAAIHHHFGSREGLLDTLLRFSGRRVRDAIEEAVRRWGDGPPDIAGLTALALDVFGRRGYSRLIFWLALSGPRDEPDRRRVWPGSGMFAELAAALQRVREEAAHQAGTKPPSLDEARFLAALIVMTLVAEPFMGEAARRSVGLAGDDETARRFLAWFTDVFGELVCSPRVNQARPSPAARKTSQGELKRVPVVRGNKPLSSSRAKTYSKDPI